MMQVIKDMDLTVFSLIILAILIAGSVSREERKFISNRLFMAMVYSTALMLVLDYLSVTVDGMAGMMGKRVVIAVNTLYFGVHPVPALLYLAYANFRTHSDYRRLFRASLALGAVFTLLLTFTLLNLRFGQLFTLDESNRYVWGGLFPLYIMSLYACILFVVAYVLRFRKKIDRRDFLPLLFFPLPTLAGGLLQIAFYGTALLWTGNTIAMLVIFLHIQNRKLNQDYLTGAFNRRFLDEYLELKIRNLDVARSFFGLFIDLDAFKKLNDRFGHAAGDDALVLVVNILKSSVREADFVARYAGDEFVVILETDDEQTLARVIARIRASIARFNEGRHRPYSLGLSIGSARFDRTLDGTPEAFLKRIDALMYLDKIKPVCNDGESVLPVTTR